MCKCCIQKEIQKKASFPVLFQKAHTGPISHCSCLFMSVSRNLSLKNLKLKPVLSNILKSKTSFYRFNMGHNPLVIQRFSSNLYQTLLMFLYSSTTSTGAVPVLFYHIYRRLHAVHLCEWLRVQRHQIYIRYFGLFDAIC